MNKVGLRGSGVILSYVDFFITIFYNTLYIAVNFRHKTSCILFFSTDDTSHTLLGISTFQIALVTETIINAGAFKMKLEGALPSFPNVPSD